jgi:hypothetical protein
MPTHETNIHLGAFYRDTATGFEGEGDTAQIYLDTDVDGNDDYAGVGWFHITGQNEVHEQCPLKRKPTPCRDCGRTDITPDENCPWGCKIRKP